MSRTSTPNAARVENTVEVTPGRSLPVSVMSRVWGRLASYDRAPRLTVPGERAGGHQAPSRSVVERRQGALAAASASAAVMLPPSSSSARSTMVRQRVASAARRTARGRHRRAGTRGRRAPQGHQLVGDLGPPARHVEVGEHVRRPQQRLAQRLVGLRRVGHLAARHGVVAAPHHAGTGPVRHQAEVRAVEHDALAGLDDLGVEGARARPARAGRRATGRAMPGAGRAGARAAGRARGSAARRPAARGARPRRAPRRRRRSRRGRRRGWPIRRPGREPQREARASGRAGASRDEATQRVQPVAGRCRRCP